MQMYEIEPLITNIYLKNKNSWEQSRLVAFIIAQTNSTKKLKQTDIIKFNWDDQDIETNDTTVTNDDVQRLKDKARQYLKTQIQNG